MDTFFISNACAHGWRGNRVVLPCIANHFMCSDFVLITLITAAAMCSKKITKHGFLAAAVDQRGAGAGNPPQSAVCPQPMARQNAQERGNPLGFLPHHSVDSQGLGNLGQPNQSLSLSPGFFNSSPSQVSTVNE